MVTVAVMSVSALLVNIVFLAAVVVHEGHQDKITGS